MNFLRALQHAGSGKLIRRVSWHHTQLLRWVQNEDLPRLQWVHSDVWCELYGAVTGLRPHDLMADDWEVVE